MRFTYFPGCSLKGTGRAYEESLLAVFDHLGVEIEELSDWNCCGATTYMSVDESMAFTLAARNLALAERYDAELMAPCAACYLVLVKAQRYIAEYPSVRAAVHRGLEAVDLEYQGRVRIRHPLDIIVNDIGLDAVRERVTLPLKGLKVAPYYGCQVVRPYAHFDHQDYPETLDRLMEAIGAENVHFPLKTKCCGGSLTGTLTQVGGRLSHLILKEAHRQGADLITTLCPLCQFNLDGFQKKWLGKRYETATVPVVYFTQLMGLAFGIPARQLGLGRNIIPAMPALRARVIVPA